MREMFFSTGQVARELRVTQARILALCQNRLIAAEITDGGHFRIPKSELDRLKQSGLPAAPRAMPNSAAAEPNARSRRGDSPRRSDLRVQQFGQEEETTEQLEALEREVQAIGLRRQKEEALDWFRQREERDAERIAAQEIEKRRQLEVEDVARRRERWENRWHRHALKLLPKEVSPSVKLAVPSLVQEALQKTNPNQPDFMSRRLVNAAVEEVLGPWRRRKQVETIVEKAADRLPLSARSWLTPTEWQIRAKQAARRAVEELAGNASLREIEHAAQFAVESIRREFEFQELRTKITSTVSIVLRGETSDEREEAQDAVTHALATLPFGTSQRELERVRDIRLASIQKRINERIAREQEERRRKQDHQMRERLLEWPDLSFPHDLSGEDKKQVLAAAQTAVNALPCGTPEHLLKNARDEAVAPILKAHEQRRKKRALIETAMQELLPCLLRLGEKWEFDESIQALKAKLDQRIREHLENKLSGNEPTEQVKSRVRILINRELDI